MRRTLLSLLQNIFDVEVQVCVVFGLVFLAESNSIDKAVKERTPSNEIKASAKEPLPDTGGVKVGAAQS